MSLAELAAAYGVETYYWNWRGRQLPIADETIVKVLAALGVDASTPEAAATALEWVDRDWRQRLLPDVLVRYAEGRPRIQVTGVPDDPPEVWVELADGGTVALGAPVAADQVEPPWSGPGRPQLHLELPADLPLGWQRVHARHGGRQESVPLLLTPFRLDPGRVLGERRAWGFMTQLYSMRSHGSWGLGDLRDLADLATRSARDLDAGFVLVNPLHAGDPVPPISPSPYLPTSRRFGSPLYLRVEDVPEYQALSAADRERIAELGAPLRQRSQTLDPLDRDAVWTAKRAALAILHDLPQTPQRAAAYQAFRDREGAALTGFATWSALAEEHGSDWREWPEPLRDPGSAAVAREQARLARQVDFHAWLQWVLDEQLGAAQQAAVAAGMPVGMVHDLAVGVQGGGADAWLCGPLLASGISVGAPPDEFNQRGQSWGQPPWHPVHLAQAGYAPYRDMLRYVLRHAGGLRLDHAMQVFRLWWVPEDGSPADGTYVNYDAETMLGILTWEAHQAGALVIGEDLGTVEPRVRETFAARGIFGTSMLWFERDLSGVPLRPEAWRELCLATVGTHDMPPITAYLNGDHVVLKNELGLLTHPVTEERAELGGMLEKWRAILAELGLLDTPAPTDLEMTVALHAFLARTPARLIGVSLADAVGERRTQNQPGTTDEYPNWRVPLADDAGRPVLLEDVWTDPRVRSIVAAVR